MPDPLVSVVIPTYNRVSVLRRTLNSLAAQSLSAGRFEVCVVDDGSSDGTASIASETFPFALTYLQRPKQGPTAARNVGAQNSRGEVLVFLDDDICPAPHTLEALARTCLEIDRTVVLGTLITPEFRKASVYGRLNAASPFREQAPTDDRELPFTACLTGLLAIRRSSFFEIGMFMDPTGGWPNWDDVDFGYRAQRAGFQLRQSASSVAEHWDYALADLASTCRRWQRASQSAVTLFQKYPGLRPAIPMFADKTPIDWRHDSPVLIGRKIARRLTASALILPGLERLAGLLEQCWPSERVLQMLYRWIIGAHVFRGYQRGLEELRCPTP
jgi:glycosyltransferase involved in cell wall biosynthesis